MVKEKVAQQEAQSQEELARLLATHKEELDRDFLERLKSVEEEKIMASQKLADTEHKMASLQKVIYLFLYV